MTAFALLDLFSFGNELIYCIHGTPKASVFPDPVSATPITSRPESKKGQAAAWIGVGDEKNLKGARCAWSVIGKYANIVIGRRLWEVINGSSTLMKLEERKEAMLDCDKAVSAGCSE